MSMHVNIYGVPDIDRVNKAKEARDGINPKTGEKITIAACKAPAVKFSKTFKDMFN